MSILECTLVHLYFAMHSYISLSPLIDKTILIVYNLGECDSQILRWRVLVTEVTDTKWQNELV